MPLKEELEWVSPQEDGLHPSKAEPNDEDLCDPFQEQYKRSERTRSQMVLSFQRLVKSQERGSSYTERCDTSLIFFILKAEIYLSDAQLMTLLKISHVDQHAKHIFELLTTHVKCAATEMYAGTGGKLIDWPLTQVYYICQCIALNFPNLFYVPHLSRPGHQHHFEWRLRFNGLWPLVSVISRYYTECNDALIES